MLEFTQTITRPEYGGACFCQIPATLRNLLTSANSSGMPKEIMAPFERQYQTVFLFFIDAFGWRFIRDRVDDYPFLRRFFDAGTAHQITSQFPSTTAAHVTCIHTGKSVGASGVFEWQYYEPQLDAIIIPLMHSFAGTMSRDTLPPEVDPRDLYPSDTIYNSMREVKAHIFQHQEYTPSTYSDVMFDGATTFPYRTLPEALATMVELLRKPQTGPEYYFLYYANIDSLCHTYGPESPQLEAEIDTFLRSMENLFWSKASGLRRDALFILTADHGQTQIYPETTIYINAEPQLTGVERYLKRNRHGEILAPAGSCRDMFLYVNPGMIDDAHAFLSNRLSGKADVIRTTDLINEGFFGPLPVVDELPPRLGDLVLLPHKDQSVWWYSKNTIQRYYGHHGGLSPDEMEIPFLIHPV